MLKLNGLKKYLIVVFMILLVFVPHECSAADKEQITVGITYTANRTNYITSVEKSGAVAYSLPLVTTKKEAEKQLSKIDALIIAGGSDVSPEYYGERESEKLEDTSPERDISDILMLKVAMEKDMPVLGICRGMQVMNVVRGGTLYQDIAAEYANSSDGVVHRDPHLKKWMRHDVQIEEASKLYDVVRSAELNVMSWHHQAIKSVGKALTVTATSEDGIAEAIEFDDQNFMIGVQFHPEVAVVKRNGEQIEFFQELKHQGEIYRKKVIDELYAPIIAASTLYEHDNVKINWDSVENVTGYSVYYKKNSAKSYALLKRVTGTVARTGNLTDGVKYNFKIVPYIKRGTKYYEGDEYASTSIYTLKKMGTPTIKKYSNTQVRISWKDINGQSGYQISRTILKNGTNIVSTLKTSSGTSKVIKAGAKSGKTYYYKVRAYKLVAGEKVYGPWSDTVKYVK